MSINPNTPILVVKNLEVAYGGIRALLGVCPSRFRGQ